MVMRVVAKIPGPGHDPEEARESEDHERAPPGYEQQQPGHQWRRHRISDSAEGMRDALCEAPSPRRYPGGHGSRGRGKSGALSEAESQTQGEERHEPAGRTREHGR